MTPKNLADILKELYCSPDEPEVVKAWKKGELSDIELLVHDEEISRYKNYKDPFKDFIYNKNPFLELVRKDEK